MSSPDAAATASDAAASLNGGEAVTGPSAADMAGAMVAALSQGRTVGRATGQLGQELARIALGRSLVGPAEGDRRFADPAWTANPVFRRIKQSYLTSAEALSTIVDEVGSGDSDPKRAG